MLKFTKDYDGAGRDLEPMALELERAADYRVLRRLQLPDPIARPVGAKVGLYVDCETTGLKYEEHEVIEVALVPFYFESDDQILGIGEPYEGFREPQKSEITEEVSKLTGITPTMVAGKSLDTARIRAMVEEAVIVIAHNAKFDRPFMERDVDELLAEKHWACSHEEVDWAAAGVPGSKLIHIAMHFGYFFDAHRAAIDCVAGIAVLDQRDEDGRSYFAELLASAREPKALVVAVDSPFSRKDDLYGRGYKWSGGDEGMKKGWWIMVPYDDHQAERTWLTTYIYGPNPKVDITRLTAKDRYRR